MKVGDLIVYQDSTYPFYKRNGKIGVITSVYEWNTGLISHKNEPLVVYFVFIDNENMMLSKHYLKLLQ